MTRTATLRNNCQVDMPELESVRGYLVATGWALADDDSRTTLWHLEGREEQVVLPARSEFRDSAEVIGKALQAVAYVEHRQLAEVIGDLNLGGADTLAVKLTPDAPTGEAPLSLAHTAINALHSLVIASACAALDVRGLVLPIRRPQRAEAYANQTRLSTQAGSFVLSLALPLDDEPATDAFEATEPNDDNPLIARADLPRAAPFGRRVTNRIASAVQGAQALADSVNAGDRPLRAFGEPRANAANATELAALASLGGPDSELYRVRVARSPLAGGSRDQVLLAVTPGQQRVFADASDFLRTKQPRADVSVHGLVVRLFRAVASGMGPGQVVIQGIDDDSGVERRFSVELGAEDYRQAVRAHGEGLRVIARGDLDVRGTRSSLHRLTSFAIVPPLDED